MTLIFTVRYPKLLSIGKPTNETHYTRDHEKIGGVFGEKAL